MFTNRATSHTRKAHRQNTLAKRKTRIQTRGSKEPVSLTLVYVNIKQRKQMDS